MNDTVSALREGVEKALGEYLDSDWWANHEVDTLDRSLWGLLEELGLPTLLVPPANGGAGASLAEAFGVVQALGARAVPAPAAETMLVHWLASGTALSVPDGPVVLAPVRAEAPPTLVRGQGEWLLTGRVHGVPWGHEARAVLLQAEADGADMWCLAPGGSNATERGTGLSGEPRDTLNIHSVALPDAAVVEAPAAELLITAGAALRAGQMAGAASAALALTVEYVTQRVQFGRPLAKFQAIQQQLAVMAAQATAANVAARRAFVALAADDAGFAVAAAKSAVGEATSQCAAIAHQSHGAMGFTAEYALHRLTRRIWTWREEFGNEAWWAERLGRQVSAAGADALWPALVAEP